LSSVPPDCDAKIVTTLPQISVFFCTLFIIIIIIIVVVVLVVVIIIIIIIIKVAEWFRAFPEVLLPICVRGKQISAVYGTRMSTIVFSKTHY
jgi:hypothetical protein